MMADGIVVPGSPDPDLVNEFPGILVRNGPDKFRLVCFPEINGCTRNAMAQVGAVSPEYIAPRSGVSPFGNTTIIHQ